jgi:phenylpropionate dioxygenase-like ring-hydroxylating dioxygenase large terminal subunit
MRTETQIELVERVLHMHAHRTTALAAETRLIPAGDYTSKARFEAEQATVFRDPVLACLSGDIAEPGDHISFESGGVPIVVVRAADRHPRAYVNICRHRASPLVGDPGHVARSFSCPFHGWVYDIDDGRLSGQPRSCDGFDALDGESLGLRPLPVAERHGLVVVNPSGGPVDLDKWLCGLGPELASYRMEGLIPYRRASQTWSCNWKLLLDTFFESYHVFALHRVSLSALYLGIASPFDAFGPHNRLVVPQTSILELADVPRDKWELAPHAVVQYFLAPNMIVSNLYGYLVTWRFIPLSAGQTLVENTLYTETPVITDEERAHFDSRFAAGRIITGDEDYPASELIHRNLLSGLVDHTVIGRNEVGVVHFHQTLADRLQGRDSDSEGREHAEIRGRDHADW